MMRIVDVTQSNGLVGHCLEYHFAVFPPRVVDALSGASSGQDSRQPKSPKFASVNETATSSNLPIPNGSPSVQSGHAEYIICFNF